MTSDVEETFEGLSVSIFGPCIIKNNKTVLLYCYRNSLHREVIKLRMYAWHLEAHTVFSWKICKPDVSQVRPAREHKRCPGEPLAPVPSARARVWGWLTSPLRASSLWDHTIAAPHSLPITDGGLLLCTRAIFPPGPGPFSAASVTAQGGDEGKLPSSWGSHCII